MKRYRLNTLPLSSTRLLPDLVGERTITHGGVYTFKPGEMAHPEPHVHEVDELFIFVQGSGVLPIDGVDHLIETGDVVLRFYFPTLPGGILLHAGKLTWATRMSCAA